VEEGWGSLGRLNGILKKSTAIDCLLLPKTHCSTLTVFQLPEYALEELLQDKKPTVDVITQNPVVMDEDEVVSDPLLVGTSAGINIYFCF
jgi:hypothetical protein